MFKVFEVKVNEQMPESAPLEKAYDTRPSPEVLDSLVSEIVDSGTADYVELKEGAYHPNTRDFPAHRFVREERLAFNRTRRWYSTDPVNQDTYNYDIGYLAESITHPLYVRRYLYLRSATLTETLNTALSGVFLIKVTAGGSGYTENTIATITLGGGTGATATAIIADGVVVWIKITAEGTGYTSAPTVSITDSGGGTGATATAVIQGSTVQLVSQKAQELPSDDVRRSLYVLVTRVFKTIPGPSITSKGRDLLPLLPEGWLSGNTVTESKTDPVAPGTSPTALAATVLKSTVEQQTTAEAVQVDFTSSASIETTRTSSVRITEYGGGLCNQVEQVSLTSLSAESGLDIVASRVRNLGALFVRETTKIPGGVWPILYGTIVDEVTKIIVDIQKQVVAAGTLGGVIVGDGTVAGVLVSVAGSAYTGIPTIGFAGGGGSGAAATASLTALTATMSATGTGYAPLDQITLTGGTFNVAAVLMVVTTKLVSASVNAAGSGYAPSDTITLLGGTATTRAILTITNTKLISVAINAAGSGYAPADTITLAGGTASTRAVVTIATTKLVSLAVNAAGSGYATNDTITLSGGTATSAAVVTVATTKLVSLAINAAGSGYAPSDTVTLAGGTASTKAVVTVSTSKLVSLAINAGGTGYVIGDTVTLAGGTPNTRAVITVTGVSGSAITTFNITTAGDYTANSATFTQFATSGAGTGATFQSGLFGILTFSITTAGSYTANTTTFTQDSTSGSGTGATFQSGLFGVNTFTITSAGVYTVNSTTFTQASTSGVGSGATFQTGLFGVNTFTITTAGVYTVNSTTFTQFSTSGAGSGATFQSGLFGVNVFSISTAGVYTLNADSFTQYTTSGSGSNATFSSPAFGVNTSSVLAGGDYTVLPSSPVAQGSTTGSGSGATHTLTYGISEITITNAGSGYTSAPTVTPSGGAGSGATLIAYLGNSFVEVQPLDFDHSLKITSKVRSSEMPAAISYRAAIEFSQPDVVSGYTVIEATSLYQVDMGPEYLTTPGERGKFMGWVTDYYRLLGAGALLPKPVRMQPGVRQSVAQAYANTGTEPFARVWNWTRPGSDSLINKNTGPHGGHVVDIQVDVLRLDVLRTRIIEVNA